MKDILEKIVKNKSLHAKWLNTLSYLEFVGARKIAKVLDSKSVSLTELQHFSEESRHSYMLKKIGTKNFSLFPKDFRECDLLGGIASKAYFQNLDSQVSQHLSVTRTVLNYLYVTFLVEVRALKVYSEYNGLLKKYNFNFDLNFLIREETHHLDETNDLLESLDKNFINNKLILSNIEEELFLCLCDTLRKETLLPLSFEGVNA